MNDHRRQDRRPRRSRKWEPAWTGLSDEELLGKRFCDLRLTLRGTAVERHFAAIQRLLERRGLRLRPHLWLSEEWFSPDGVPGIAVPFYLAHPRLQQLERRMMREAEPGGAAWLTRILRHETGHALDNAFRLRRRKGFRETFGRASLPYADVYRARPSSRDFVVHLGRWYAQSHPTEDFAETFAVWLQPRARWRRQYRDWPALRKLEYVDDLMSELAGQRPPVAVRTRIEPLHENRTRLREHYRKKSARAALDRFRTYDLRLERVFGKRGAGDARIEASAFLRRSRAELERSLTRRARLHPYLTEHVLRTVIQRCHELDLVLYDSQGGAGREVLGVMERIAHDLLRRDRERYHR